MRLEHDVEDFESRIKFKTIIECPLCHGSDYECTCRKRFRFMSRAYSAHLPKQFWDTTEDQLLCEPDALEEVVRPYIENSDEAKKYGYGLFFSGKSMSGKTSLMCYVMSQLIQKGHSGYYTTVSALENDLRDSFIDKEIKQRLMFKLASNFVAFDDMNQETLEVKSSASFIRKYLTEIMKKRADAKLPTFVASDLVIDEIKNTYGKKISKIVEFKCEEIFLNEKKSKEAYAKEMRNKMGFKR